MFNIVQTVMVIVIFVAVKYAAWKVTEENRVPQWLHYMPYICFKCLGFWSLTAIYIACGFLCDLWITMGVGVLLTLLDTIALHQHEKSHMIKIE